ncbi:hypothetical protein ACWGSU_24525 [Streptomyces koyangensis]
MPHIRNHQVFATWITGLMHDAGAPGPAGAVRRQAARAEPLRESPRSRRTGCSAG